MAAMRASERDPAGFISNPRTRPIFASGRAYDEIRMPCDVAGIIDRDDLCFDVRLHQRAKGLSILGATAKDFNFFNRSQVTHHLQMAPGLPSRAIEPHDFTVFARQMFRSHGAGNRGLSGEIVVIKVIEGKRADNDRQKLGCLAVIGHVDTLAHRAIGLVLFGVSMTLIVNECAGDAQIDAAAGVNINPPITRHHPLARGPRALSDRMLQDWLGELCNQLAGRLKGQLLLRGLSFKMGTPLCLGREEVGVLLAYETHGRLLRITTASRERYEMAKEGTRKEDRATAAAHVNAAGAQASEERKRLDDTRLVAPISGNIAMRRLSGGAKPLPQRKMRARRRAKWGVEKT